MVAAVVHYPQQNLETIQSIDAWGLLGDARSGLDALEALDR